jgi:hypothetical protein
MEMDKSVRPGHLYDLRLQDIDIDANSVTNPNGINPGFDHVTGVTTVPSDRLSLEFCRGDVLAVPEPVFL